MKSTYRTSEIAQEVGIHANTVRLYEKLKLIPEVQRENNGYRIFTDYHVHQFHLARVALKVEVLQNGLRKKMIQVIKLSAQGEFNKALEYTEEYIEAVIQERINAEEAIEITKVLLAGDKIDSEKVCLSRKETARNLNLTIDTLRNWEMNGLLRVKRKQNGYRVYTEGDINRLKIIRTLRCANYSLASILRMLCAISGEEEIDIRVVIDNPQDDEDIVTACDKLLTSLDEAQKNAEIIFSKLKVMKELFSKNPTL